MGGQDGSVFSLVLPLLAPGFGLALPSAAQGPRPARGRDQLGPGGKVSGDARVRRGWGWAEDAPGFGTAIAFGPRRDQAPGFPGRPRLWLGKSRGLSLARLQRLGEPGPDLIPRPRFSGSSIPTTLCPRPGQEQDRCSLGWNHFFQLIPPPGPLAPVLSASLMLKGPPTPSCLKFSSFRLPGASLPNFRWLPRVHGSRPRTSFSNRFLPVLSSDTGCTPAPSPNTPASVPSAPA